MDDAGRGTVAMMRGGELVDIIEKPWRLTALPPPVRVRARWACGDVVLESAGRA
jgi:hypothetical protein